MRKEERINNMHSFSKDNNNYFHYILVVKKSFTLISEVATELGKYLIRKIEKELKFYDTEVVCLAIEKANKAGQPHIHILIKTKSHKSILLNQLEIIKRGTPRGLCAQHITPKVESVFSRYRGEMQCEFYRNKDKCPGRENCSNKNEEGELKCRTNNNLKDCTHREYLNNVLKYITNKKDDTNCLFIYEREGFKIKD